MPFIEIKNPLSRPEIQRGILKDFGEALFREMGLSYKIIPLPKRRMIPELLSGEISLICYSNEAWLPSIKDQVTWSNEIFTNANYLVSNGKNKAQKISDLYGKRVGAIVNFYYPSLDPYFEKGQIYRENGPNNESNIEKLLHDRIDYLILSNLEFEYHHKLHPQLTATDLHIDQVKVKCALSKKSKIQIDQLNKAIETLRKTGALDRIFKL